MEEGGGGSRLLIITRFSSLLLSFWDCGDIYRVPDLCLETLRVCPHLHTPNNTHTHTLRAETHSSPGAGAPCAPVLVYLREAGEAGWEHTLLWILCSACQCGSFDPQPADDRSTLSSQSSRARAASAQAERCCKSASISGNQLSAGGRNPACRNMSSGCKLKNHRSHRASLLEQKSTVSDLS